MSAAERADQVLGGAAVAVVASLNVDHIVRAPRIPVPGETLMGSSAHRELGGKGGNQAVAAARLGAAVAAIGCVGMDEDGDEYLAALQAEDIDVSAVSRVADVPTGRAAITVDDAGANSIVVVAGANAEIAPADAEAAVDSGASSLRVVVGQLEASREATVAAFSAARRSGILTVFNPAPVSRDAGTLVPLSDLVVPNEIEFQQLTGEDPHDPRALRRGASELLAAGARWVVVTLGEHGCAVFDAASVTQVPAVAVAAVDTTAAGDSFIGALAAHLAAVAEPTTDDVIAAAQLAVRVAAVTVTRAGAHPSLPRVTELPPAEA
jgi:ribokinase